MTDTALLKYYLERNKITQSELAKMLGITVQSLNTKINNKRAFSPDEIFRITKLLNISLEEREKIFFYVECTQ